MKYILIAMLLSSCVTSRVVREDGDMLTIGAKTGIWGKSLYKKDLRERAKETCNDNYVEIYEGENPKTLEGIYLKDVDYYLVIRCN